ncbi:protein of unknown function [Taphrina deformans PYCC 5710]|uniref:MFS transporter n=1 Tax=Taphrina deformans (strain PYCC 5710 / ATCC 11124 / CBS 356.35 / IMI 108563 / JCM 9778 / NBRC 8474) TaxID=1097556 RepID=R4XGF5_TAPDE|nr:protein of unknown function [Taphrina deformans PYCC 5710]|eukprot:CCG84846.1 protein of unknown function [Taphrina deformans PYCC 5710]
MLKMDTRSLRTLQITTALTYCLFSVGICFGFAALKPVLIASHVYESRCEGTPTTPTVWKEDGRQRLGARCVAQELALNEMFTWAAVSTNVSAFPIGLLLDRVGMRATSLVGTVLMFLGSLGLALARDPGLDVYVPSYTLLATSGSFLLLSSFSLAGLVPRKSGLIVSGMTGAFDASSGLFLVYRITYQALGRPSVETFFAVYLLVPVLIFIVQLWYMPRKTTAEEKVVEEEEGQEQHQQEAVDGAGGRASEVDGGEATETTGLLQATDESRMFKGTEQVADPVDGVMHAASTTGVLTSAWFLLPALVMVASLIRVNFFIATVHAQLIFFIGAAEARSVMDAFDVLLPVGGLFAIPLIGWILDTYTTSTVYLLTLLLSAVSGALSFVPNKYAQILHIVTFVVLRPWIYSILPGTVTKLFGNERFGAFYGLIMAIAGLVNLLAHDLEVVTYGRYHGSFVPVNAGLVGVSVGTLVLTVVYMKYKIARMER